MGILEFSCYALNGTRLMAMALAMPTSQYTGSSITTSDNNTAAILVESVPNPATLSDFSTMTVKSIWNGNLTGFYQTDIQFQCTIDPLTGIFTAVHSVSSQNRYSQGQPVGINLPGGFQYDPRTDHWSPILFSADYTWKGDPSSSFTIFNWPNTTTLYLATINPTNASFVNVGMLNQEGGATFVNSFNWTLDHKVSGFPQKLAYGHDAIYQIGRLVTDTGAQKLSQNGFITRIPLPASPNTFILPTDLTPAHSAELDNCASGNPGLSSAWVSFYSESLYMFCNNITRDHYSDQTYSFKYQENGILTGVLTESKRVNAPLQVMARYGNESNRWAVAINDRFAVNLGSDDFGNITQNYSPELGVFKNISYGRPVPSYSTDSEPNYAAITGGAAAAGLVIFILLVLAFRRWVWRRLREEYWPRWKDQIKAKLLEMLTKDEDHQIQDGNFDDTKVLQDESVENDKVEGEEISMRSFDLDGRDKILVTDDMSLSDVTAVNVDTAYMDGVAMERHPRPNYVTVLTSEDEVPTSEPEPMSGSTIPSVTIATIAADVPINRVIRSITRTVQAYTPDEEPTTIPRTSDTSPSRDASRRTVHATVIPPLTSHRLELPSAPPGPTTVDSVDSVDSEG
ncbi:hypothetical protein BGZ83_009319 [Gryganskiella cystojenkinii]|nr:hypothetical protein BGZ83_009319 [Gryganskiella cystojenkinii]